jgi:outer membrane protein OmpA-like peptidoglycan-associated protein
MRSLLLASGCAALGLADLAWLDLRLAPGLVERPAIVEISRSRSEGMTMRSMELRVPSLAALPLPSSLAPPPTPPPTALPPKMRLAFDVDARELSESAKRDVDAALAVLSADPALVVVIDGHADRTGTPAYNDDLSRARADAVAAMLAARGAARSRLSVSGHGARRPIAPGNDAASLARNRRVELSFERRRP